MLPQLSQLNSVPYSLHDRSRECHVEVGGSEWEGQYMYTHPGYSF